VLDIIRVIKARRLRWAGHVAHVGEMRNAYKTLVGKREGKKPLGRPRHRWEDNIRISEDGSWIHVAQVGTSGGLL
jgi:hypothetical protein